jgi:hypothetical protein
MMVGSEEVGRPLVNRFSTTATAKTAGQPMGLEKSGPWVFPAHIELNPWPFLWAVVGAWLWYGALRLAHMI